MFEFERASRKPLFSLYFITAEKFFRAFPRLLFFAKITEIEDSGVVGNRLAVLEYAFFFL